MDQIVRYPLLVFALALVTLWVATKIGVSFRKRRGNPEENEREDFGVVVAGTMTLLGDNSRLVTGHLSLPEVWL